MSAVGSRTHDDNAYFSPVTFSGIKMNTWHDSKHAILRLFQKPALVKGIRVYSLQECNRSTIKSAEQFNRLIDKGYILTLTKDEKIIAFPNFGNTTEPSAFFLSKGNEGPILLSFKGMIRMADPADAEKAKKALQSYSTLFEK